MWSEYLKHLLIRTPLEGPLHSLRAVVHRRRLREHPELSELYSESGRITELLRRVLKPTSNCVDVGAHLGSMLSAILKLAPSGRHVAFEPLPHKARWLRKKFPEVHVHAMCLSDRQDTVNFTHNVTRSGFSGLGGGGEERDHRRQIQVPCDRLDNVLPIDFHVDFLKIDVEGAECSVLRGAEETIRRCRPLTLFECTPDGMQQFGLTPEQVWEYVTAALGYAVQLPRDFLAHAPPLTAHAFASAIRYPPQARNFIAVPASF